MGWGNRSGWFWTRWNLWTLWNTGNAIFGFNKWLRIRLRGLPFFHIFQEIIKCGKFWFISLFIQLTFAQCAEWFQCLLSVRNISQHFISIHYYFRFYPLFTDQINLFINTVPLTIYYSSILFIHSQTSDRTASQTFQPGFHFPHLRHEWMAEECVWVHKGLCLFHWVGSSTYPQVAAFYAPMIGVLITFPLYQIY